MKPAPHDAFKQRVRHLADKLEVDVLAVALRAMRNKWASCSSAGRLTFDGAVLSLPADLQDYIIVHELLQLKVPNHGKLWKALMRAHLGGYERAEARLKRIAGDLHSKVA